jgi:hypothetical protein
MSDTNKSSQAGQNKIDSWRMVEDKETVDWNSPVGKLESVLGAEATAKVREIFSMKKPSPKEALVATSELAEILGRKLDVQDGTKDGIIKRENLTTMLRETLQASGADSKIIASVDKLIPVGDLTTKDFENQMMGKTIEVMKKIADIQARYDTKAKLTGTKMIDDSTPKAPTFRAVSENDAAAVRQ